MTTTHNPQRCAEMVRALRELARRAPGPGLDPSARWNLELADQLEAAKALIDQHATDLARWRQRNAEQAAGEVQSRDQLTTERDALRAKVAKLKAELANIPAERRAGSPMAQLRDDCRAATLAARKKE